MLQSFLSPIRSRFDNVRLRNGDMNDPSSPDGPTSPHPASLLSPRSPFAWGVPSPALSVFGAQTLPQSSGTDQEDMANAEEFARDVLVELMRGLLEDLRTRISSNGEHISPDDVQEQIKILSEIRRIMRQDVISLNLAPSSLSTITVDEPRTKAVFRELDGFVSLLSALSALSGSSYPVQSVAEECVHLVFLVFTEALRACISNQIYFQTKVGWESMAQVLFALLTGSERSFRLLILSHLLSLALEDFEAPFDGFFFFPDEICLEVVDQRISEVRALRESTDARRRRLMIRQGPALRLLWDFVHAGGQRQTRYALCKVLEVLYGRNHRNGCVLSGLGIVGDVFDRFQEVRISLKYAEDHQNSDECEKEKEILEKEKHVLQRLLRKLLEMGANTTEARRIFQASVTYENGKEKLDAEILEVVRSGMKTRWVEHFSFEGNASIVVSNEYKWKTLPKEGISLLMWFYPSTLPSGETEQLLFSAESKVSSSPDLLGRPQVQVHAALSLLPDGRLKIYSSASVDDDHVFTAHQSKIRCARWTHLALIWYPKMGGHPNLRLYLDGIFVEGMQLPYPRTDAYLGSSSVQYKIGDHIPGPNKDDNSSWCLASAYLLGFPLPSDIPRLIQHLGPRYAGSFQEPGIVKFLTYEAATSLNMYLANSSSTLPLAASPTNNPSSSTWFNPPSFTAVITNKQGQSPMLKALREGLPSIGIREEILLFGVGLSGFQWGVGTNQAQNSSSFRGRRQSGSWSDRANGTTTGQKMSFLGDTFVVKAENLDDSLWKCGGAAVGLRLVDLAGTPHELSRSLGILTDGLKNSWQNSEDMERMRGYDILGAILRRKANLINLTAFETLFEFFGLNFSVPEQSTIVNPVAYKVIALDFSLWAKTGLSSNPISSDTKLRIPLIHLDHFATLFERSRYRTFNWAVGLGEGLSKDKAGSRGGNGGRGTNLVRKMLFALQMGWYRNGSNQSQRTDEDLDMTQYLIDALGSVLRAPGGFGKDDIKAMVAYLAANLSEVEDLGKPSSGMTDPTESSNGNSLQVHQAGGHADGVTTPQSAVSHFSFAVSFKGLAATSPRANAEKVLELLVHILSENLPDTPQHGNQPSRYHKFTSSLPMNRILLLLLGERPTSHTAALILRLIGIGVARSSTFTRKFELVSGWNILKVVMSSTSVWDREVDAAAWDLLLGKIDPVAGSGVSTPTSANAKKEKQRQGQAQKDTEVSCPQVLPTIFCALRAGLVAVADRSVIPDEDENSNDLPWATESLMERLIERLVTLHASSGTFRQTFESLQATQLFIDAYNGILVRLTSVLANAEGDRHVNGWSVRILEKLSHFGLALALDKAVGGAQKQEILDKIRSAEALINPGTATTSIDPSLVVDNRSIKSRLVSARFSTAQVGERAVIKTMTRIVEWRLTVRASERKRLRKMMLDLREFRRQVSRLTEWTNLLTSERGLWPRNRECLWRLDETEGPNRIRKKLEYETDNSPSSRVDSLGETTRDVQPPETESATFMYEVPPWAESYEISATEVEEQQQLAEEIVDDKLRRIRHELEPGDVIEAVATVARVDGVDAYPGILIFGCTHIYMLDGVVENDEGEVIDAQDAPRKLFFIPGSRMELNGPQKARWWPHTQLASYSEKKFLFRDVALEIYFKDSRSLLIVFLDKRKRTDFENRLSATQLDVGAVASGPVTRPQSFVKMGSRLLTGFRLDELSTATRKWQARELSNFAYLSILNAISGRTPSDATQYPIFPWVLSDYTSQTLDLNDPASYRDLTKPMGALTAARRLAAETRYTSLQGVGEEPFHYGTHFSSSMMTLQGGDWDLPDRLFSDLRRAYESAAVDVRGDVRELIPEFFTCPEFLENSANHDFGMLQQTGEKIHDVKLPPWAREDPLLFIVMNRRALESSTISEQLPAWIDLIWGCKQRDPASLNVFHPLSYEGSIDLDSIKDDLERDATVGIIHNFGQTPRKLFHNPHPARDKHGLYSLPVGVFQGVEEDPHLLTQNSRCFRDHGSNNPVRELVPDHATGKVLSCPEGVLCLPQYPHEHVEWRVGSTELRVVSDDKVIQVIENACCACATFADTSRLVTGSSDYMVRLWKVSRGQQVAGSTSGGGMHLALSHIMRVHTDEVICVAASRQWSLVVSGSKDGSAALWDLNKGAYVRSIWHAEGDKHMSVDLVAINDSTGYVATCSRLKLCLHTINARPIATLDLTTTYSFSNMVPTVTAMAFHERDYSPLGVLATGGPDGSITLRTWTADGTPEGEKAKWEFLTIRTMKVRFNGLGRPPAVTALKFLGENLHHGEETGKSYTWNLRSN